MLKRTKKKQFIKDFNLYLEKWEFTIYICGYLGVNFEDIKKGEQKYVMIGFLNGEVIDDWYWEDFNKKALKKFSKWIRKESNKKANEKWSKDYLKLSKLINQYI